MTTFTDRFHTTSKTRVRISCSHYFSASVDRITCPHHVVRHTYPHHLSAIRVRKMCPHHVSAICVRIMCLLQVVRTTCPQYMSASFVRNTCPYHVSVSFVSITCPQYVSSSCVQSRNRVRVSRHMTSSRDIPGLFIDPVRSLINGQNDRQTERREDRQ